MSGVKSSMNSSAHTEEQTAASSTPHLPLRSDTVCEALVLSGGATLIPFATDPAVQIPGGITLPSSSFNYLVVDDGR